MVFFLSSLWEQKLSEGASDCSVGSLAGGRVGLRPGEGPALWRTSVFLPPTHHPFFWNNVCLGAPPLIQPQSRGLHGSPPTPHTPRGRQASGGRIRRCVVLVTVSLKDSDQAVGSGQR